MQNMGRGHWGWGTHKRLLFLREMDTIIPSPVNMHSQGSEVSVRALNGEFLRKLFDAGGLPDAPPGACPLSVTFSADACKCGGERS